jgi:hypothetical protein
MKMAYIIHDKDTDSNGELLEGNNPSSDFLGRNLGEIDGDLRRANTDTDTVDETKMSIHVQREFVVGIPSNNQHRNVLRRGRNRAADYPDKRCELDGVASSKVIRDKSGGEGTKEGSPGHCGSNAALFDVGGIVKVIGVLCCPEKCRQ